MRSPYSILGVPIQTAHEDIKKRYKRKAMQSHPDKGGDPEEFAELCAAYAILSDDERRKQYDDTGTTEMPPEATPGTLLEQLFTQVISTKLTGDVVETAKGLLGAKIQALKRGMDSSGKLWSDYTASLGRVNTGIFDQILNRKIAALDAELKAQSDELQMLEEVRVVLEGLEDSKPMDGFPSPFK